MPFKDIQGHQRQIERLMKRIRSGRLAGAYIFCGPEGIGKKMVALAFAQAANCLEEHEDACGRCVSCVKIARNIHPDVHVIDKSAGQDSAHAEPGETSSRESRRKTQAQSQEIRIDDIRMLQQEIFLKPYEAKLKVFIVNDAHMLNPEASNAFLKTLEEPPKNSVIILVSDKPRLLFKTIVSRCWTVKFSALSASDFTQALARHAAFGGETVRYLARACEGRLGSALVKGRSDVLAEKNRIIDYFILQPNPSIENSFIQDRTTLRECLQVMAGWFRDLSVCKAGLGDRYLINADRTELLKQQAAQTSFTRLDEIIQTIQDALLSLEQNANTKLVLACVLSAVSYSAEYHRG